MIKNSHIEWTGLTYNPWQGCVKKTIEIEGQIKLREECRNCYMYRQKKQYGQKPEVVVRSAPATFNKPLKIQKEFEQGKRPNFQDRLIFACSWSDWFNPEADQWRPEAWQIVRQCPDLVFQILTKLIDRAPDHLPEFWDEIKDRIWIGTSAGYQEAADWAIPHLLRINARVRFLSCEPLLGSIDLRWCDWCGRFGPHDCEGGYSWTKTIEEDQVGIDWVITGGESGPKSRPTHPDWVRGLRDQCLEAGVPFFHKQWGEYCAPSQLPDDKRRDWDINHGTEGWNIDDPTRWKFGKKATGRLVDGKEWSEFPRQVKDLVDA